MSFESRKCVKVRLRAPPRTSLGKRTELPRYRSETWRGEKNNSGTETEKRGKRGKEEREETWRGREVNPQQILWLQPCILQLQHYCNATARYNVHE